MSKKSLLLVLFMALAALLAACGGVQEASEELKMAAIFPGTITDADYNTLGHLGVTSVTNELGVATAFSESVAVPDVSSVMREYLDDGYNIIFTHGGQFLNQTTKCYGSSIRDIAKNGVFNIVIDCFQNIGEQ